MSHPPEPPPWGVLIEKAREGQGLSVRESARRAGISEGWWRQIVRGYQNMGSGSYGTVPGPAGTVADMARVVKVTPDQMETAGERPDAAKVMREVREIGVGEPSDAAEPPAGWLSPDEVRDARPFANVILSRMLELRDQGIKNPRGADLFPRDEDSAEKWDKYEGVMDVFSRLWFIANRIAERAAADMRWRTGLIAPLVRGNIAVHAGVPGGT
jgi:hypothetical protein